MIADLKPYAEYKESGLSWLGRVPSHWRVVRNGSLFGQRNQTGYADLPILEVSLKTGVRLRDFEKAARKQVMSDLGKYKRAAKGDVAYNMMRMWQGAVGVSPVDGLVSPAYVVARPYPEIESRFFAGLFRTGAYMGEVDNFSRGIVKDRNRLYWDQFKQMLSPCPPPEEQAAIVRFLDWTNGRLERAIQAKRKVIALLNEQKRAIIHRAVTCGLDPSVPLKPSGIPWLGDIPRHWEARKLGALGIFYKGRGISKVDITESGVPAITYGDIYTRYGIEAKALSRCTSPEVAANAQEILSGDLLFTASGETIEDIGKTTLYSGDVPGYAGGDIVILRLLEGEGLYLSYALNSSLCVQQKSAFGRGDIIVHISASKLKQVVVPLPPQVQQIAIARFLDEAVANIAGVIDRARREIDLLREYRIRLAADVVTGKLDVRAAAARLPEEVIPDTAEDAAELSDETEAADEEAAV